MRWSDRCSKLSILILLLLLGCLGLLPASSASSVVVQDEKTGQQREEFFESRDQVQAPRQFGRYRHHRQGATQQAMDVFQHGGGWLGFGGSSGAPVRGSLGCSFKSCLSTARRSGRPTSIFHKETAKHETLPRCVRLFSR